MATKTETGTITQNQAATKPVTSAQQEQGSTTPQSITTSAQNQGLGSANTPKGAQVAGGTTQQQAMAGTPAQQQNARKQESGRESLTQKERVETAAGATDPQKAAQEKMDRLQQLGSTKTQIEALIQQSIQNVQNQSTPQMQVATDALAGISDPAARTQAQAALETYSQNPTEENMKAVYDAMGRAGVDAGISRMFQPQAETLASAAQGQQVTLGTLNMQDAGVDMQQLANDLGISLEEAQNLTMEQLNQKIDAAQAQEFQSVASLQARLSDPSISPQERQQVLDALRQQGAAGITGVEAEVNKLQQDLENARSVNMMGRDFTVEELLGDDGISDLIKQAVTDPNAMRQLMEDERTKGLGEWITENKAALTALSQSFDTQAQGFMQTQDQLAQIGTSLGEGNQSVLEAILGQALPSSMLSGDLAALQSQLADSGIYQALKGNPMLTTELKNNPELLQALAQSGMSSEQIQSAVAARDALVSDPQMAKLIGMEGKIPTSPEELEAMQEQIDRVEAIDPRVMASAAPWVDSGDLDLEDIEDIAASSNPNAIFQDIQNQKQVQQAFANAIKGVPAKDQAKAALFGSADFSANDLASVLKSADAQTKQSLLSMFDSDGDGKISDTELNSTQSLDRVKAALGVGASAADIIAQDGQYLGQKIGQALAKLGVDKGSFEKETKGSVSSKITQEREKLLASEVTLNSQYNDLQGSIAAAQQEAYSSPAMNNAQKNLMAAFGQGGSGLELHNVAGNFANMSSAEMGQYLTQALNTFNAKQQDGSYLGNPFKKGDNRAAAEAQIRSMEQMLKLKKDAEAKASQLQAQAKSVQDQLGKIKQGTATLRDSMYNLDNLNEDQLYKLAQQYGVL